MKIYLGNQPDEETTNKTQPNQPIEGKTQVLSSESALAEKNSERNSARKIKRHFLFEDKKKRNLNGKRYVGNDGTCTAIYGGKAVHYYDDTVQGYADVDNSLAENGENLQTKANSFKTRFSRRSSNGEIFELTKGKNKVKLISRDLAAKCACGEENCICQQSDCTASKVLFKGVKGNVDFQYAVDSDRVKENIIVNERAESYEYNFDLNIENLEVGISEDGKTLQLKDKESGEVKFYIPEPYMIDAAGKSSDLVYYEIDRQTDSVLSLKIAADEEWLNAEDRKFPVVIDPQIVEKDSSVFSYEYQQLVEKSHSDGTFMQWETTAMPDVAENLLIDNKHRLNVTIRKDSFELPKKALIKVELSFYVALGNFFVQDKYYEFERGSGDCIYDITNDFKKNGNEIHIQIYNTESLCYLKDNFKLIIEYLENETVPEKKTFSLCGGAVAELNIANGESVNKLPDLQVGNEAIPFAVFHTYKLNDTNFRCGKDWRLNLHQKLIKSGEDYVYTDENGWKHLAQEKFYIIRNNKREEIEDNISTDSYGVMTYTENRDGCYQTYKVYRELQTKDGLRVVTRLDGYDARFIEQRQDEEKQAEENVKSYKAAIEDLRMVSEDGNIYSTVPTLDSNNLPNFLNAYYLILSQSEALQFQGLIANQTSLQHQYNTFSTETTKTKLNTSTDEIETSNTGENDENLIKSKENLYKQLENIKKQINTIINSKQAKYEYACSLYKEYLIKKQELTQIQRQMPVSYVIKDEQVLCFNRFGNLCGITNGAGEYLVVQWDDIITKDGKAEAITAVFAGERSTAFTYNFDGNLSSINNFNGDRTDYEYSSDGALKKVKYSTDSYVNISYSVDAVSGITDGKHNKTSLSYKNGKLAGINNYTLVEKIADGGVQLNGTYNLVGTSTVTYGANYVSITADNATEYILLDENKKSYASYVKENGKVRDLQVYTNIASQYSFTAMPKKTVDMLNANGSVSTEITNVLGKTLPDISSFPDMTEEYGTFVEADWETTDYDSFNRPLKTYTNWRYKGKSESDKNVYVYNEINYEYAAANVNTPCLKKTAKTYINTNGSQSQSNAKCITKVENYSYNDFNKLCRTESYVQGEEGTSGITVTERIFDENGNVTKEFTYNTLDSSTKFYKESEISENGVLLADFDQTGERKTGYEYEKGVVKQITNPNGGKFAYGYDESGNVTAITQSTDDGEENSTNIKYTLECPTRLTSGNNVVYYEYDRKRRATKVEVNGTSTEYSYDDENGIKTTTFAGHTFTTQKDKDGNVLNTRIDGATQLEYVYKDGLLKSVTDRVTNEATAYEYTADKIDRLKKVVSGGLTETYKYTAYGELAIKAVTGAVSQAYGYFYKDNAARDIDYVVLPNGLNSQPLKDVNGRNVGRELKDGNGNKIYGEYISYRKVGGHGTNMPSAIWYAHGNEIKDNIKYKYDSCGNIIEIRENGKFAVRYSYDSLNRIIREDNKKLGKSFFYSYDGCGNVTSKRETAYTFKPEAEIAEYTEEKLYSYDGDRLTSFNGQSVSYDSNGNPVIYRGVTLEWEYGKRLKKFGETVFTYDGFGRRIRKGNIAYTYGANGNLIKQSDGTNTLEFVYDTNGISGFKYNGENYIYRKSVQGDISAILDLGGNEVASYTYDAWGNYAISGDETLAELNPYRYRSYYYDTETGLYYLQTRYYDPEVGRFISQDDVSYLDPEHINGLNLFAYCGNNPVMNIDPNGTFVVTALILGLIIGAIVGATVGGVLAYEAASANGATGWELFGWTLLGMLGGAVIGGAIGAAVGGFIGAIFPGINAALAGGFSFAFSSSALVGAGSAAAIGSTVVVVSGTAVSIGATIGAVALGLGLSYIWCAKRSGKERATDKPSWVNKDMIDPDLSAQENATNLLNNKYGLGGWPHGPGSEFNKIVKWVLRALRYRG